jgi:hypothetical protein
MRQSGVPVNRLEHGPHRVEQVIARIVLEGRETIADFDQPQDVNVLEIGGCGSRPSIMACRISLPVIWAISPAAP